MGNTGSLQAVNVQESATAKNSRMSYEYRAGQVELQLAISSEVTIYDLARLLHMSARQMHNICNRMADEGRIAARQVPYRRNFKYLISRPR